MEIRGDTTSTIAPEVRGSTLGLALTDETTTEWEFVIDAGIGHAFARVGTFRSAAPTAGAGKTRWIGWAHAPGVTAWRVTYRVALGPPNAAALLELAISDSAFDPGLTPNGSQATVVP